MHFKKYFISKEVNKLKDKTKTKTVSPEMAYKILTSESRKEQHALLDNASTPKKGGIDVSLF